MVYGVWIVHLALWSMVCGISGILYNIWSTVMDCSFGSLVYGMWHIWYSACGIWHILCSVVYGVWIVHLALWSMACGISGILYVIIHGLRYLALRNHINGIWMYTAYGTLYKVYMAL